LGVIALRQESERARNVGPAREIERQDRRVLSLVSDRRPSFARRPTSFDRLPENVLIFGSAGSRNPIVVRVIESHYGESHRNSSC
jgi:hypothetical protein